MKKTTILLSLVVVALVYSGDFTGVAIVHPDTISGFEQAAVKDLQDYLTKATGKQYQLIPESEFSGGKSIQTGFTASSLKELPKETMPDSQQWRIKDAGDTLFITGGSSAGVAYGIYDFLNRNGIYWLTSDCEVVPEITQIKTDGWDISGVPSFRVRDIYHGLYSCMDWAKDSRPKNSWDKYIQRVFSYIPYENRDQRFRISYKTHSECHSFHYYLPPEKYAEEHPEYYSMGADGKRYWESNYQLCFSNPDVRRLVKEQLFKWIEEDRKDKPSDYPALYDFSQQDNSSFYCYCQPCQEIVKKYGGDTGLLLDMVNEMAREAHQKYPDVYIQTFAYVNTEVPLDTIKPEKNVVIKYCDLYSQSNCFVPVRQQPARENLLKKWLSQTSNVYLWDYWNMGGFAGAKDPGMLLDAVIDDLRFFHQEGLPALFIEAEIAGYRPQSFIYLQYFLAYMLMKDINLDPEKLIDLYIRNYYGSAAEPVRLYFDFLRTTIRRHNPELEKQYAYADGDFLKKAHDMLTEALQAAGDNAMYRKRVIEELNVVDYRLIRTTQVKPMSNVDRQQLIGLYQENMTYAINNHHLANDFGKKRALAALKSDVDFFQISYELPQEVAKYEPQRIHRLAYPQFPYSYIDARVVKDPLSEMALSIAYLPEVQSKHKSPFSIGLYDQPTKRSLNTRIAPVTNDENYHWYKLGRFKLGRQSIIWGSGSWHMSIELKEFYTPDDGIPDDSNPNLYDVWVNVRFSGPVYIKGSESANGVYIDKIVLARPF